MKELPKGGILGKTLDALTWLGDRNIPAHAAGSCYFISLSVFPALVLLLALLRYTSYGVEDLMELLDGIVPAALLPFISSLFYNAYSHSSDTLVSLSAVVAVWSASYGIYGLKRGLNAVYDVRETRNYFLVRGMCMLYTLLFLVVLILTLVLHVFGTMILGSIPVSNHPLLVLAWDVIDFRFFLLLFVQTVLFTVIYKHLPDGQRSYRACLPGALLASIGWLIFSDLFSIYMENMQHYSMIFGSVYAVALALLWLYCCISIVFYGGLLNHWLQKFRK